MDITHINKHLEEKGVKILPWIGKDYECGLSFDDSSKLQLGVSKDGGSKVLVLGECIYSESEDKDSDENEKDGLLTSTIEILKDYLNADPRFNVTVRAYRKFERSLSAFETQNISSSNLWNHLAYYTYVQKPIASQRHNPNYKDYEDSEHAFFQVLTDLKPNVVIVWGNRLYSNLPDSNKEMDFIGSKGKDISFDGFTIPSWIYKLSNVSIHVFPVYHPASGYAWNSWHKVIVEEFKNK